MKMKNEIEMMNEMMIKNETSGIRKLEREMKII
jgi:hypothetical protein